MYKNNKQTNEHVLKYTSKHSLAQLICLTCIMILMRMATTTMMMRAFPHQERMVQGTNIQKVTVQTYQ